MSDPIPGSKAALAAEKKRAASIYDPSLPMPAAAEMERCLISCMMQAPEFVMESAASRMTPEHFSVEAHSLLWDICLRENNAGRPLEPASIVQILLDRELSEKVGGPAYVSEVYTASPNAANAPFYATHVHEKWRQRQTVLALGEVSSTILRGIEPDALTPLLGDLESRLMRLSGETLHSARGARTGEDVMFSCIDTLIHRHRHKGRILGLQFGVPDLDRRVNGFQRGDFIVVGARPAMGKTSLATTFAENVAIEAVNSRNCPVLMFTLEMGDEQIMERSLLGRAHIGLGKGRTGMFSDAEAAVLYAAKKSLSATRGQSTDRRRETLALDAMDGLEAWLRKKGRITDAGMTDNAGRVMSRGDFKEMMKEVQEHITHFAAAVAATSNGAFTFYDGYGVTVQEVRSQIRRWVRQLQWRSDCDDFCPPLVVIDYLQLVKPSLKSNMGDPRLTSIEVCEAFKGLAKELGIIIMGLAQVKVNDKRPEAEPQLSDIKESGAYAEFADYVFTLHRAAYYRKWPALTDEDRDTWDERAARETNAQKASRLPDKSDLSNTDLAKGKPYWGGRAYYEGHAKLSIRKARHCATDDVNLFFRGTEVRFVPITTELFSNNTAEREQKAPAEELDI